MIEEKPDELLVEEFNNGKSENFGILFQKHQKSIFNLCYRMLGNYEEAEDTAQEIFIKAYENLIKFRGDSSFKTWIYRIATTTCIDVLRKRKSLWNYLTKLMDYKSVNTERENDHLEKEWIQEVLKTLPPNQRLLLVLRYIQGFSNVEIGKILNCSEDSLKVKLFRARENFKEKSKKHIEEGVMDEL
jgi:RNA polymerase sigma-70 factor (ECF subfamily)